MVRLVLVLSLGLVVGLSTVALAQTSTSGRFISFGAGSFDYKYDTSPHNSDAVLTENGHARQYTIGFGQLRAPHYSYFNLSSMDTKGESAWVADFNYNYFIRSRAVAPVALYVGLGAGYFSYNGANPTQDEDERGENAERFAHSGFTASGSLGAVLPLRRRFFIDFRLKLSPLLGDTGSRSEGTALFREASSATLNLAWHF